MNLSDICFKKMPLWLITQFNWYNKVVFRVQFQKPDMANYPKPVWPVSCKPLQWFRFIMLPQSIMVSSVVEIFSKHPLAIVYALIRWFLMAVQITCWPILELVLENVLPIDLPWTGDVCPVMDRVQKVCHCANTHSQCHTCSALKLAETEKLLRWDILRFLCFFKIKIVCWELRVIWYFLDHTQIQYNNYFHKGCR